MLDKSKTHWVVIRHCHFTGHEFVAESRKTKSGALKAMNSLEYYNDPDEFFFDVMRSDEAVKKGIRID